MQELTRLIRTVRSNSGPAKIKFNFVLPKGLFRISDALDRASMFGLTTVAISSKPGWFRENITIRVEGECNDVAAFLDYVNGRLIHIEGVLG